MLPLQFGGPEPKRLMYAQIPILGDWLCPYDNFYSDQMICAGYLKVPE